jgi:hypothetical protein
VVDERFDALTDTNENRRNRQRKRQEQLNKVAQDIGYETWHKLETAVIHGKIVLTEAHILNLQPNKDYWNQSVDDGDES